MAYEILDRLALELAAGQRPILWRAEPLVGGVNNWLRGQRLTGNESPLLQNTDLDDPTTPRSRDGYSEIGAAQTNLVVTDQMSVGAYLNPSTLTERKIVIAVPGDKLYHTPDSSTAWTAVTPTFDIVDDGSFLFQVADSLYVVSGDGSLNVQQMAPDGTLTDGGNVNASPPRNAVDGMYLLNRPWLLKPGAPPELHYGKLVPGNASIGTDWSRDGVTPDPATAGRLQLSPNRGGQPKAVFPWQQTNAIVFFEDSIELVGINAADPSMSSRAIVEKDFGTVSRNSVVAIGQDMIFMDQYGDIRTMRQTVNAEQAGVALKPLSEKIKNEIPGRLNFSGLATVTLAIKDDRLFVFYPRGASTVANAYFTYHLSEARWVGPNLLDRPVRTPFLSNIDGGSQELYALDGSEADEQTRVYHHFDGSLSDNGVAFIWREETPDFHLGAPESEKLPEVIEVEAVGSSGQELRVEVMINQTGVWAKLDESLIVETADDSYPLTTPGSFPLVSPGSFPLTSLPTAPTRKVFRVDWADGVQGFARNRTIRFAFTSTVNGGRIERLDYRFVSKLETTRIR